MPVLGIPAAWLVPILVSLEQYQDLAEETLVCQGPWDWVGEIYSGGRGPGQVYAGGRGPGEVYAGAKGPGQVI